LIIKVFGAKPANAGGYEKVLAVKHPDMLMSVDNFALVLDRQGKYEDAEELN
jgi:hypothetical protein